jgi:tetratricopeptide (TPR) repeat protein
MTARINLGNALLSEGRFQEAEQEFRRALEIDPVRDRAHYGLGLALDRQGRHEESMSAQRDAVRSNPSFAPAHLALGLALSEQGRREEAVQHLQRAVALEPGDEETHNKLGEITAALGRLQEAEAHFEDALRANPGYLEAAYNLAQVLQLGGRTAEALERYGEMTRATGLTPNTTRLAALARVRIGDILLARGEFASAATEYDLAGRLARPLEALDKLAWLRATCPDASVRDAAEAVSLARSACSARAAESPECLVVLAAAYAESGDFVEAERSATRGLELARSLGDTRLDPLIDALLGSIEARRPFRDETLAPPSR